MDRGPNSGAAEVPDVSAGLDVRTPETVKPANTEEAPNSASEPEDARPSARLGKRKRRLSEPQQVASNGKSSRRKRRRRDSEPESFFSTENSDERNEAALMQTVPQKMRKYFAQRHRLFHRYDEGIQLDEEAWYSVTPEKIAAHIASRFAHLEVVVDLYSCVGGNSIQFAKAGMRVIAVEIDQQKIDMAKNNALVYGVRNGIEFKHGDVFEALSSLKDQFDKGWGIFLSPPWGGPGYVNQEVFDVSVFKRAINQATETCANVAMLVPRNISVENVAENFGRCEVEENYLGGKLKTKTLYFGDLEGRGATAYDLEEV